MRGEQCKGPMSRVCRSRRGRKVKGSASILGDEVREGKRC